MRLSSRTFGESGRNSSRISQVSGSSPEEILRKEYTRFFNWKLEGKKMTLLDLRDLTRTENLVALCTELCGRPVPGAVERPSVRDHDHNIACVVNMLSEETTIEWGAAKLIKGVQDKNMGFIEVLAWHLVEVGEFKPAGLPIGNEKVTKLAEAIEQRLSRYITLQQFHFRYTREMIFDIVRDCTSWEPSSGANDIQNLRDCFKNIESWGVPVILDPEDIKSMGSVNEKGFLLLFALFIPSLEGTRGPKKQAAERKASIAAPAPVVVETVSAASVAEIEALVAKVASLEKERLEKDERSVEAEQKMETVNTVSDNLKAKVAELERLASDLQTNLDAQTVSSSTSTAELRNLRNELEMTNNRFVQTKDDSEKYLQDLRKASDRIAELDQSLQTAERDRDSAVSGSADLERRLKDAEERAERLADRIRSQDFDGLEAKYLALIQELELTQGSLVEARGEAEALTKKLHALELKMPLYLRQGKNTVPPPTGEVTLCFTDVEGSTVQWEYDADSMATAIRNHNEIMRSKLHEMGGYEVKTEGDAFMVAFPEATMAVKWCLDVQESLLTVSWPEALYSHEKSTVVESKRSGKLLYRGLRVRMGIHTGHPSAEEDPVTGRMDYFGKMVNRAARVESVAHGGQIVMSAGVHERIQESLSNGQFETWNPEVIDLGSFELKGLNDPTHILQILPESLTERKFEAVRTKEQELQAEKVKLETQLQEMEEKNKALNAQLRTMDEDVQNQMDSANKLLEDVQAARLDGAPPDELLKVMGGTLKRLVQGQTATAKELHEAQLANTMLFDETQRATAKQEALFQQERENLEANLGTIKLQLDDRKVREEDLVKDLTVANKRIATLEDQLEKARRDLDAAGNGSKELEQEVEELEKRVKKSREDRVELMNLRVTVNEMQVQLDKGGGPISEVNTVSNIVGPSESTRSPSREPSDFSSIKAAGLDRALTFKMCYNCDLALKDEEYLSVAGRDYHLQCLACGVCGKLMGEERVFEYNGKPAHDMCRGDDY